VWGPPPRYRRVEQYDKISPFKVIAGPCSVEDKDQIGKTAAWVSGFAATHLRGGVFRAGTYPKENFGLVSEELIADYAQAAQENGLKCVIEVLDYRDDALAVVGRYADCFQVGCRSMQNYTLLRRLAEYSNPIFLKRHPGATLDEWLGAAEHILSINPDADITLIERGSSSHVNHVRWDLSISMIPAVKAITNIPVVVDASHGTGRWDLVEPMTLAGVAAGAGGILVETHPNPQQSISDADQAISFDGFSTLMKKVINIRKYLNEGE